MDSTGLKLYSRLYADNNVSMLSTIPRHTNQHNDNQTQQMACYQAPNCMTELTLQTCMRQKCLITLLLPQGMRPDLGSTGWGRLAATFPAADQLLTELQTVVQLLVPLAGPRVAQAVRSLVADLFQAFITALLIAAGKHKSEDGSLAPKLGAPDGQIQ